MGRQARSPMHAAKTALLATACVAALPAAAGAADAASGAGWLSPERVAVLKVGVALGGAALLLWKAALRRVGRADAHARTRDGLLLALGILGALAWWNFLQNRFVPGFAHPTDTFHYYIGSKYFDELRYKRLYVCTTVADAESGQREQALQRSVRNLETYRRESGALILRDPTACTRHFSPARWEEFKHDIGWFRGHMPEGLWQGVLADHGYNPTPVWGAFGRWFTRDGPVSEAILSPLVLIDPILLIFMWAFIGLAFGWRATCVALIFWGTNLPGDYSWTGGAFLRQGWLASLFIGICCLRLGWMTSAGFLLTLSALLRVFPAAALFAVALGAGALVVRQHTLRIGSEHRRLLWGCAAAIAMLVPFSIATAGGSRAWVEFADNIRFHSSTPFANNVGMKAVFAYDPASRLERLQQISQDAPNAWLDARNATFARRRIVYFGFVLVYLALLARAVAGRPDWQAAVLGTGAVVVVATMSNYYFGLLLGFGLLGYRREGIGAALCGLSAVSWFIEWSGRQVDETYTAISIAAVAFVLATTAWMAFRSDAAAADV